MTCAASIRTSSCAARASASSVNSGLPPQSMSLISALSVQTMPSNDPAGSGTHIAINVSFCAKASLAVGLPMTEFFALFKNARSTTGIVMMGVRYTEGNCPLQGRGYIPVRCAGSRLELGPAVAARGWSWRWGSGARLVDRARRFISIAGVPYAQAPAGPLLCYRGPRKAGVHTVKSFCLPLSLPVDCPARCVPSHGFKY